ncbi:hypothetical protein TorRG33x02_344000 [Trema orientale]|uniref:Uncharacterized protein n=1 Tax=Trema orientale TaxID=63057 RepID=A0A2P5AQV2_TREOI|nr:hypothetical protein TorRG33x02_344000 [Trema orientale]
MELLRSGWSIVRFSRKGRKCLLDIPFGFKIIITISSQIKKKVKTQPTASQPDSQSRDHLSFLTKSNQFSSCRAIARLAPTYTACYLSQCIEEVRNEVLLKPLYLQRGYCSMARKGVMWSLLHVTPMRCLWKKKSLSAASYILFAFMSASPVNMPKRINSM